jgi:hypothetical protein
MCLQRLHPTTFFFELAITTSNDMLNISYIPPRWHPNDQETTMPLRQRQRNTARASMSGLRTCQMEHGEEKVWQTRTDLPPCQKMSTSIKMHRLTEHSNQNQKGSYPQSQSQEILRQSQNP